MSRRPAVALVLAALLAALLPAGAKAQVPGPQEGFVESLCPRAGQTDEHCYTIGIPGEVWAAAAVIPLKEGETAEETAAIEAAYDSLLPEPFYPLEDRREIGVLMFRLDIEMTDRGIDDDPGPGYAEGTVAIRAGFPAEDGYPYREGWWVLAQPLNDQSQHGAGRDIGLPKYMADSGLRIDDDGRWRAWSTDWGYDDGQSRPGNGTLEDGNILEITWTPKAPEVEEGRQRQLWLWGQYGEALFVNNPPYDEDGPREAGLVKFTPFSLVPVQGLPATPFTHTPDPRIGTATVTLQGEIPASDGLTFSDLVEPGPHTVPGTSAFTRGGSLITVDNLEHRQAE